MGFPGATVAKNLSANAEDARNTGLIPGSGRSSGEGKGIPVQYSCLGNPMDREAWQAIVHGVTKNRPWLSIQTQTHAPTPVYGTLVYWIFKAEGVRKSSKSIGSLDLFSSFFPGTGHIPRSQETAFQKLRAPTELLLLQSPLKEMADIPRRCTCCCASWGRDGFSGSLWCEEGEVFLDLLRVSGWVWKLNWQRLTREKHTNLFNTSFMWHKRLHKEIKCTESIPKVYPKK